MFHKISAAVVFVRDLARCLTFYQDTLGLQVKNSAPESVAFRPYAKPGHSLVGGISR
jgi:lactoylglutathione lyase